MEILEGDVIDPAAIGPFLNIINTGYGDYPGVDWSNVEPHNAVGHAAGQAIDGLTVVASLHELQHATRAVVARFGGAFDVLVTPTMSIEPPLAGSVLAEAHAHPEGPPSGALAMAAFTAAFNITGQPAVSLPLSLERRRTPGGGAVRGRPLAGGPPHPGGRPTRRGGPVGAASPGGLGSVDKTIPVVRPFRSSAHS